MSLYNKVIDQQKLSLSWQKVKKNHPAAGVDQVSWQQFDECLKQEIYKLHVELREHQYEPLPVKEVALYKGEKVRKIALFSMRDKVLQQSLTQELEKIFELRFSKHAYAYRQGKSALDAAAYIEKQAVRFEWALKLDIKSFFDTIVQKRLLNILKLHIKEDDVIELIKLIMKTKMLDVRTGQLTDKKEGIYQGSSLAPVWSNIYMMEFDALMEEQAECYVRYSDDILFLGHQKEALEQLERNVINYLKSIGLSVSEQNTSL